MTTELTNGKDNTKELTNSKDKTTELTNSKDKTTETYVFDTFPKLNDFEIKSLKQEHMDRY